MAGVYLVTGKLGNGKSLVSVGRIKDALLQHRRIATNLNINLKAMFGKQAKNIQMLRIPDKPSIQDLNAIGKGYEGKYDENKFGLLVLDECGTWFNSRNWQDKTRKDVNDWFLHARKLGWEVYILIQDISILDSQAREAIAEMLVSCRRLDNLRVPLIGGLFKLLTGINLTLPRIHRAKVTYADGLLCDVWVYRGNDLFACYDTRQLFLADYPHGVHSILPPWYTHGRYVKPLDWSRLMRITKIYWKRFSKPVLLATGLLLGAFTAVVFRSAEIERAIIDYQLQKHVDTLSKPKDLKTSDPKVKDAKQSPEKSPEVDKQSTGDKVSLFLAKLKIIGNYSVNAEKTYTFSTGEPDKYLTSVDIRSMGFQLKPLSDCLVEVSLGDSQSLVRCF
jgi:hypothetical protein